MQARFIGSIFNFFSVNSADDIELIAGNNIGDIANNCYVKNDLLYLNAGVSVIGNLNRYQTLMTFMGYKVAKRTVSIGGTYDGKTAQIYCEPNTSNVYINTANGIKAGEYILVNLCVPVTKE